VNQQAIERAHALLSRRTPDWSLDQPFYVDRDIFDLEMELFFKRQWLFVALACEIPRAGDWVRVDVGRESVIVLRRKDGEIAAFHIVAVRETPAFVLATSGAPKNPFLERTRNPPRFTVTWIE